MKNKVRMITFWFLEKKIDGSPDYIVKNIKLGDKLYGREFNFELFDQLNFYDIDYNICYIGKDNLLISNTNIIWISIPGFEVLKTTLNNIPKKVLEFAKINNVTILINNVRESFQTDGTTTEKGISNFIERKKFPKHLIKVIINNHGLPNTITKPEYFRPINFCPGYTLQYLMPTIIHERTEKKYNFCCFSGQIDARKYRLVFLASLMSAGLVDNKFFLTHMGYNKSKIRKDLRGADKKIIDILSTPYVVDEYGKEIKTDKCLPWENWFTYVFNKRIKTNLPPAVIESCVYIALESRVNCASITEKTWWAMIYKVPFLVLGCKNLHTKVLQEMGFELYDEVFDYSFDKAETITNRTNLLVKEIRRLSSKDLTKIQGILKPKLEFNYNHFMKIANDNFNWVYSLHGN